VVSPRAPAPRRLRRSARGSPGRHPRPAGRATSWTWGREAGSWPFPRWPWVPCGRSPSISIRWANGLAERLALFAGPLAALEARGFPVVVANLLRRELLPLLPGIAERVAPGGCVVLSGLLVRDRPALEEALAAVGLAVRDRREARDGGERWLGLVCAPG